MERLVQILAEVQPLLGRERAAAFARCPVDPAEVEVDAELAGLGQGDRAVRLDLLDGDGVRALSEGLILATVDEWAEAKDAYEASNYTGKPVSVNGSNGKVTGVSFGKVTVKFEDGTKTSFPADQINPPVDKIPDTTLPETPANPATAGEISDTSSDTTAPNGQSDPEVAPDSDIDKFSNAYSAFHLSRFAREAKSGKQSAEYYDQQRADWTPENVRARVAEFLKVIDSKNVANLVRYNNGMFDGFWKLFGIRTGMHPMPKTQTGMRKIFFRMTRL